MYENAQEIFDYLPIRRDTPENDYIDHLRQAFVRLDDADDAARPFAVMPFHLLFMLVMQYKVLRIANAHKSASDLFFSGVGGQSRAQLLRTERSVFDMALINEKTMPEIFQLISLDSETIKRIKSLVSDRNDKLAHAKGGIEPEVSAKIGEYLTCLRTIQIYMQPLNDNVANSWTTEVSTEDVMPDFIEARLVDSMLCSEDFITGTLPNDFANYIPGLIDNVD